jgi:hypothetical protein
MARAYAYAYLHWPLMSSTRTQRSGTLPSCRARAHCVSVFGRLRGRRHHRPALMGSVPHVLRLRMRLRG